MSAEVPGSHEKLLPAQVSADLLFIQMPPPHTPYSSWSMGTPSGTVQPSFAGQSSESREVTIPGLQNKGLDFNSFDQACPFIATLRGPLSQEL